MRHTIHPAMQTKTLMTLFLGVILVGFLFNFGLLRTWWAVLYRSSHTLVVDGTPRTYELTAPPANMLRRPLPLIVFLHGHTENAKVAKYRSGMESIARHEGFAIAWPEGLDRAWNVVPPGKNPLAPKAASDMKFIDALTDDLVTAGIADPHRIYLAGSSQGGQMALLIACVKPDKFAAVAAVTATLTQPVSRVCQHPKPMPLLLMEGTADTLVPWAGVKDADPFKTYLPVADTLDLWKRADRCNDVSETHDFPHLLDDDPTHVRSQTFTQCGLGTKVALYTLTASGHQVPSTAGDDLWNPLLGPRAHDIEMGHELWRFFAQFEK